MARSGSASRWCLGVSSWNAAVRMPIFMYAGSNARVGTPRLYSAAFRAAAPIALSSVRRDLDPAATLVAGERRIKHPHLPQPIVEMWIVTRRVVLCDRPVETAKQLCEGVTVAFGVPARQIRIGGRPRIEKRRIFQQDLVAAVPMADPQLVRALLVPCRRRACAVDFDRQPILAPGGHLTDGQRSSHGAAEMEKHAAVVFRVHRGVVARRVEGGEIHAHGGDPLARYVF